MLQKQPPKAVLLLFHIELKALLNSVKEFSFSKTAVNIKLSFSSILYEKLTPLTLDDYFWHF